MASKTAKRQVFCRRCGESMGVRIVGRLTTGKQICDTCWTDRLPGTASRGGMTADELRTIVERGEDGGRQIRALEVYG